MNKLSNVVIIYVKYFLYDELFSLGYNLLDTEYNDNKLENINKNLNYFKLDAFLSD